MTYPQPSSTAPVLAGQQTFRLITKLASAGDIYESEVSGLAFALGPESDVANVRVTYYAAHLPGGVGSFVLSQARSYDGRVDARNDQGYITSPSRKGRILYSMVDLYDPSWRPPGFDVGGDRIEFIEPVVDVIQYLSPPNTLESKRSDRTYRFQYLPPPGLTEGGSPGVSYLAIPAYGRKSAYFWLSQVLEDGLTNVAISIHAVRFSTSGSPAPDGSVVRQLYTDQLGAGENAVYTFRASAEGVADMFLIQLGDDVDTYDGRALPIMVTLSDDPL